MVGIISNLLLVGLKVFVYLFTNSVSVLADAINNLTDSLSSVVTLIGMKMSNRPADSNHPYGHGRIEYVAGLVVSALIFFAGFEFIKISFEKIINPVSVTYSNTAMALMLISCFVKFLMSIYYKKVGKKINSQPILAQSKDSISDVFVTLGVILSIIVFKLTGKVIDGWAGLIVSLFILYQGYDSLKETISEIIGKTRPNDIKAIEDIVLSYEEVISVHDIVVVDFGPQKIYTWMDIELDDKMTFIEAHNIVDKIEREIYNIKGYNASIHLDPMGTYSEDEKIIINELNKYIEENKAVLSFHDLFINNKGVSVDVVVDGDIIKREDEEIEKKEEIKSILKKFLNNENFYYTVNIDKIFKKED